MGKRLTLTPVEGNVLLGAMEQIIDWSEGKK